MPERKNAKSEGLVPAWTDKIARFGISRVLLYGVGGIISILLLLLYLGSSGEPAPFWPNDLFSDWGRVLIGIDWAATPDKSLALDEFDYIGGKLYAVGNYKNVDTRYGADVHGVVAADGCFWLRLRLLASNDRTKWHTVAKAPQKNGEMIQKVLLPGESFPVCIDLDPYKPLVNAYRYGRMETEAGQPLDFELKSFRRSVPIGR